MIKNLTDALVVISEQAQEIERMRAAQKAAEQKVLCRTCKTAPHCDMHKGGGINAIRCNEHEPPKDK